MHYMLSIILFLGIQFFLAFSEKQQEWGYFQRGEDWKQNPEWFCHGSSQSPVNIQMENVMNRHLKMQIVKLAGQVKASIKNTGKTIKSKFEWLEIKALDRHFRAKSVVFKAPSEHTINGNDYGLEMQIIMEDLTVKGQYGILSLLFQATRTKPRNQLLAPFAAASFNLLDKNSEGQVGINFVEAFKQELLYLTDLEFVNYQGSITVQIQFKCLQLLQTPPCVEIIEWFILRNPLKMSIQESEAFNAIWKENPDFSGNLGNSRKLQPLYGRELALGVITGLESEYFLKLIKEDERQREERALAKQLLKESKEKKAPDKTDQPSVGQQQPPATQQPPAGQQQPPAQQQPAGQQQPASQQPVAEQPEAQQPAAQQQQPAAQQPPAGQQQPAQQPPAQQQPAGQQQPSGEQPPAAQEQQPTAAEQQQPPETQQQSPPATQQQSPPATQQQQPPATQQQFVSQQQPQQRDPEGLFTSKWFPWNWPKQQNINSPNKSEKAYHLKSKKEISNEQLLAIQLQRKNGNQLLSQRMIEKIIYKVSENLSKELLNLNDNKQNSLHASTNRKKKKM